MNRTHLARRGAALLWVALMGVLMAGGGNSLSAQTAEGTVITNTATATYTDANGNTYSAASGQVSVTVGFLGSLDVTSPAAVTPASPSTGNTTTWTITNNGNGADTVSISGGSSDPGVATITGYDYLGTVYPTLAALNAALATVSIPAGGNITIDVVYDVPAGQGGNSATIDLTATSTRTGGDSNNSATDVNPDLSGTVDVTGTNANIDRLPSNGTTYSESFTVTSNLTGTATIDLAAAVGAPNAATVTIVQIIIDGAPQGAATGSVALAAGANSTVVVEYTVDGAVGDAGSSSTVTLGATATAVGGSPSDSDDHVVTIIAPSLSVVKSVHASQADAEGNTASTLTGNPQPGATIWYRVQVTNNGTAPAVMTGAGNGISDDLTGLPVTYVAASLSDALSPISWTTLAEAGGVISGTIAGGLPGGGGTAWFVFAVTIN